MTSTGSASSKSDGFNRSPGSVGDQQDHRPQVDMSTSEKVSIIRLQVLFILLKLKTISGQTYILFFQFSTLGKWVAEVF